MQNNPLEIIIKDHDKVKNLLSEYRAEKNEEKDFLADRIINELSLHMEMEEEIFYPNIEKISDEAKDLVQEAMREHNEIKAHLEEIELSNDESQREMHFDEMEKELLHHIEEEEDKIFIIAQQNLEGEFSSIYEEMADFKEENGLEIE